MDETTVLQGLMARKLPTWAAAGLVCPHRLALEQCSGERTASYKGEVATRLFPNGGERMADLTGGLGVDFSILARHFTHALYVERQGALCETARRNFERLGLTQAEVTEGDGREVLRGMPHTDLIYMDPARRDSAGRKTVRIGDCEPDVKALLPLLWEKTDCVLLKLSPMLDLTLAARELGCVAEAHIVGDGGECRNCCWCCGPTPDAMTSSAPTARTVSASDRKRRRRPWRKWPTTRADTCMNPVRRC